MNALLAQFGGSGFGPPPIFMFFFVAIFVIVIGGILFGIGKSVSEWASNNAQPAQCDDARIVSKRTEVSGGQKSTSTSEMRGLRVDMETWQARGGGCPQLTGDEEPSKRSNRRRRRWFSAAFPLPTSPFIKVSSPVRNGIEKAAGRGIFRHEVRPSHLSDLF